MRFGSEIMSPYDHIAPFGTFQANAHERILYKPVDWPHLPCICSSTRRRSFCAGRTVVNAWWGRLCWRIVVYTADRRSSPSRSASPHQEAPPPPRHCPSLRHMTPLVLLVARQQALTCSTENRNFIIILFQNLELFYGRRRHSVDVGLNISDLTFFLLRTITGIPKSYFKKISIVNRGCTNHGWRWHEWSVVLLKSE